MTMFLVDHSDNTDHIIIEIILIILIFKMKKHYYHRPPVLLGSMVDHLLDKNNRPISFRDLGQ